MHALVRYRRSGLHACDVLCARAYLTRAWYSSRKCCSLKTCTVSPVKRLMPALKVAALSPVRIPHSDRSASRSSWLSPKRTQSALASLLSTMQGSASRAYHTLSDRPSSLLRAKTAMASRGVTLQEKRRRWRRTPGELAGFAAMEEGSV